MLNTPYKWETPDGHSPIITFISEFHPLSDELKAYITAHTFPLLLKKFKHLFSVGQECNYLYFNTKGILRGYVKHDGKEITMWIASEYSFITSTRGFFLRSKSLKNVQALEDVELIGFHYDSLKYCFEHFIEMNIIGRKIMEQYYRASEERALIAKLPSAKLKYERFLKIYSNNLKRIPIKYVASFLGISLETFIRIKNSSGKYEANKNS